jgi:hypothetical protein
MEGLKKTMENLIQDSRYSGQDLNPEPPEYEAALTTSWPRLHMAISMQHTLRSTFIVIKVASLDVHLEVQRAFI